MMKHVGRGRLGRCLTAEGYGKLYIDVFVLVLILYYITTAMHEVVGY